MNSWWEKLDERQKKELDFALTYRNSFNHGTDGHTRLLMICRMSDICYDMEIRIRELEERLKEKENAE